MEKLLAETLFYLREKLRQSFNIDMKVWKYSKPRKLCNKAGKQFEVFPVQLLKFHAYFEVFNYVACG